MEPATPLGLHLADRLGAAYVPVNPLTAYDLLVHLPQATAATLDREAVACSPREVRDAVSPR